jgi:hypothetical protein
MTMRAKGTQEEFGAHASSVLFPLVCTPEACVPPAMKTLLHAGLMLLVFLGSCGPQNTNPQISSDAWREDLRYLARELPSRHFNAFHAVSREIFDAEIARLDAAIPRLNGDEVLVGFMRVVALSVTATRISICRPALCATRSRCNGSARSCA